MPTSGGDAADGASAGPGRAPFRVGLVTGVTVDAWARRWRERVPRSPLELVLVDDDDAESALGEGRVAMCFLRDAAQRPDRHLIPLYSEAPVVVVGRDHPVAAYDEIDVADLVHELLLQPAELVPDWLAAVRRAGVAAPPQPPPLTVRQLVETVAAGTGIIIVPASVARVNRRKDVVSVPVLGVAPSTVGLGWPTASVDDRTETFIGIVRGRTAHSSRGGSGGGSAARAEPTKARRRPRDVTARRSDRPRRGRRG